MAYKTSVIQYFFYFALILNFKLKKKVKTEQVSVPETGIEKKSFSSVILTLLKVQNRKIVIQGES
jgi:hypothetical protein